MVKVLFLLELEDRKIEKFLSLSPGRGPWKINENLYLSLHWRQFLESSLQYIFLVKKSKDLIFKGIYHLMIAFGDLGIYFFNIQWILVIGQWIAVRDRMFLGMQDFDFAQI